VRPIIAFTLLVGFLLTGSACSSKAEPPVVAGGGRPFYVESSPAPPPCPEAPTPDAGEGDPFLDASPDVSLGIGTVNPTTPSDGGFDSSAPTQPVVVDAGRPCR
jgi:hypothetical protein